MSSPRVLLAFPPQWSAQNPHFALRGIAGHLRRNGVEVVLRDLNIEWFDRIFQPEYLTEVRNRLHLMQEYLGVEARLKELLGETDRQVLIDLQRAKAIEVFMAAKGDLLEALPRQIADAVETLRDPRRFYNPDLLIDALETLDLACQAVSMPYHPARLALNYFEQPDCLMTVENMVVHTEDAANNMFAAFYDEVIPSMLAERPEIIGISINAFSQVLPGLTLARKLREAAGPDVHITIGGNFFERVKDTLAKRPRFFEKFADSVAIGEGEHTMLLLARAVHEGRDLDEVPNLLHKAHDAETVRVSPVRPVPKMDAIGIQDLEGLPLDKYLSPELVLTIQAGKGCYWGLCSFCDSFWGVTEDEKSLDRLVQEIRHLKDNYGIRHFQLIDEAIRPAMMRAMAERFIAEKLDITWFSNGRLENGFTAELMELLYRSGLRLVLWGVETGSPRIHELIKKGVAFERRLPILKGSADAGIWNFAYIFFGFPTETREEAQSTIDMICSNTDIIHSYGRSVFTLGRHSALYREAEKQGILEVHESFEELSANAHYTIRTDEGMKDDELSEMMTRCTTSCEEAYGRGLWFYLRYREFMHLYVQKFGVAWVSDRKIGTHDRPERQYY
ncbi:MAG: radical SAM protein [Candidatus Sericytochromatia bacterium]|nr:radical SAM protein [Candidatus Sericytochromatia bacterium]